MWLTIPAEEPMDPPFHTRPNLSMGHQEFFRLFPAKCELERAGFDVDLGLDLHIEMGVWPTRVRTYRRNELRVSVETDFVARLLARICDFLEDRFAR